MTMFKITEKLEYNAACERYEVSLEATSKAVMTADHS